MPMNGDPHMAEWTIEIEPSLIDALSRSIDQGPVYDIIDGEAVYLLIEETIARVQGLKIEIFANEHPPPHFRVQYQGSTANFKISDCSMISGSGQVTRFTKNIIFWWQQNKPRLIDIWNQRRPSDCPVGEYRSDWEKET